MYALKLVYAPKSHKMEHVLRLDYALASIPCEHYRSSRNNPHYAPRHIIYYLLLSATRNKISMSVRCQRCTEKKKNKKIRLRCIVIGACAVQILHYIPLYRHTQHYATLNCSVKMSLRAGGT